MGKLVTVTNKVFEQVNKISDMTNCNDLWPGEHS